MFVDSEEALEALIHDCRPQEQHLDIHLLQLRKLEITGSRVKRISPAGDPNSKIQTGTKRKIWKQLLFSTHRPSLPWTPSSHNRDTITK